MTVSLRLSSSYCQFSSVYYPVIIQLCPFLFVNGETKFQVRPTEVIMLIIQYGQPDKLVSPPYPVRSQAIFSLISPFIAVFLLINETAGILQFHLKEQSSKIERK